MFHSSTGICIYVVEHFFRVYTASSKHEEGWENNIEKNINTFALAHRFLDCIARKLQDCWRTATLSVVLKILKDSLLSSSYVRATHLPRASCTDSSRDIHVPGNSCEKFKILLS